MARYKTIDIRIWMDEKFMSLDEGCQLLFIYLLTSQNTTPIGTLSIPTPVLAAWLRKDIETVSKRLGILSQKGLIRVSGSGLIWIRNYLRYNPPANPKVANGYCKFFDEMPTCSLQAEIAQSVISACESKGNEYVKQVKGPLGIYLNQAKNDDGTDTVSEPYRNQEQEQEYISTNVDKEKNIKKESQTETEKPRKTRNAPLKKPDDVSDQVWEDFLQIRKAKHAPLTETALNGIRREAEKADISLEAALQTCCERGWQGFKADWYRKESYNGYSVNRKSEMPFPSDVSDFTGKPLVEPM